MKNWFFRLAACTLAIALTMELPTAEAGRRRRMNCTTTQAPTCQPYAPASGACPCPASYTTLPECICVWWEAGDDPNAPGNKYYFCGHYYGGATCETAMLEGVVLSGIYAYPFDCPDDECIKVGDMVEARAAFTRFEGLSDYVPLNFDPTRTMPGVLPQKPTLNGSAVNIRFADVNGRQRFVRVYTIDFPVKATKKHTIKIGYEIAEADAIGYDRPPQAEFGPMDAIASSATHTNVYRRLKGAGDEMGHIILLKR